MLLFGGGPLIILILRRPGFLFLALWLGGFICYRLSRPAPAPLPDLQGILRRIALIAPFLIGLLLMLATNPSPRELERRRQAGAVLRRFLVLGTALTLFVRAAMPGNFLDLPRHHPALWLAIMLLYPLLSVWPQEVIFRRFLFARYNRIFANTRLVAASALAFGFAHIIFLNWVAVAMTLAGGAIFAADYNRNRSLGLACLEHSLYGCLIFTIGLGRYFYTGATWHH